MPSKLYNKYIYLKDKNNEPTRTISSSKTSKGRSNESERKNNRARKKDKNIRKKEKR